MVKNNLFEKIINENLIKNLSILLVLLLSYNTILSGINSIDVNKIGDFLMVISILLVTVCFANFAFSYEFSIMDKFSMRLLSHFSTFIFLLLIALLLEVLVISIGMVYPSLFFLITTFSILLYLGVVAYDFWDLFRILHKQ